MRMFAAAAVLIVFVLDGSAAASAQALPPNFEFKRETGQETGVPYFYLVPREEAMSYDSMRGSTFEALGAMIQPERGKYGLLFYNAKPQLQLRKDDKRGVLLKVDGEEIKVESYAPMVSKDLGLLKLEMAAIVIDRATYSKIVKADDVFIRVGSVAYSLDQDNIDALRYFAAEVERDLTRRKKTFR